MIRYNLGFILLFTFLGFTIGHSQEIESVEAGRIFSVLQADSLFGRVTESAVLDAELLKKILQRTNRHMMFQLIGGAPVLLGDARIVLYPEGKVVDPKKKFHLFSRSKVEQLLMDGESKKVIVEKRDSILTVTSGSSILEFSVPCPPYCD